MSKRYLLAGASALMLTLALPLPAPAQTYTVLTIAYSVAAVQRGLNDLGYSAGPVDGLMGSKTRSAIRAYQIDKGLPVSGEPSRSLNDHLQETLLAGFTPATGADSASIVEVQTRLRDRGYNVSSINGTLDASTTAAIRTFQSNAGLPVNGMVTAALLDQLRIGSNTGDSRSLTRAEVVRLQTALTERGYDTGPADGVVGPKVRGAIRSYQTDASLPVTGDARYGLLAKLEMDTDEAPAANTQANSGGNSTSQLMQIEGEMQRRGYYIGEFDGVADDQLRSAIRAYQSDASLPVTGEANAAFLESLKTSTVRNRGDTNSLLVWEVENQLDRHGYAVGTIDGNIDDQTRRAIQVYKNQAGLPRDGQLNFALLDHIERSNQRNDTQTASKLIWSVETELAQHGYKTGPVDGTMDPQTIAAIQDYQGDSGLAVNGNASADLLASLEDSNARNVTQADIRDIERRLNRRGYAVGTVDGISDAKTTAAIKAYQADAGLVVTGRPSIALRDHLRSSNTVSSSYVQPEESVDDFIDTFRQALEQIN
ncbi:MAG TPA: peptidoglycan-binding protein [Verrucomicrobiae bacterium]|nr:peptidoglycan-binding protein [Verrucomicrobiae bacterium]